MSAAESNDEQWFSGHSVLDDWRDPADADEQPHVAVELSRDVGRAPAPTCAISAVDTAYKSVPGRYPRRMHRFMVKGRYDLARRILPYQPIIHLEVMSHKNIRWLSRAWYPAFSLLASNGWYHL